MKKLYDLAVKTGSYEKDSETKNKYLNVGAIMEKDDGGKFILLNRTFNPAGVPNPDQRESLILSMFTNKSKDGAHDDAPPPPTDDDNIPW